MSESNIITNPNIGNRVTTVTATESTILIRFENTDLAFAWGAYSSCCNMVVFLFFDPDQLLNREIVSLTKSDAIFEYASEEDRIFAESGGGYKDEKNDDVDIIHYVVTFTEGNPHHFVLVNSSNGYYSGWVEHQVYQINDNPQNPKIFEWSQI